MQVFKSQAKIYLNKYKKNQRILSFSGFNKPISREINEAIKDSNNFLEDSNITLLERNTLYKRKELPFGFFESGFFNKNECILKRLESQPLKERRTVPLVYPGKYSRKKYEYFLYSDSSKIEKAINKVHQLQEKAETSAPFEVSIWTRDEVNAPLKWRSFSEVSEYSEHYNELPEYIYEQDNNRLRFNDQHKIKFESTIAVDSLRLKGDVLGKVKGVNCETFYTKFFPLNDSQGKIRIFTIKDQVATEWAVITSYSPVLDDQYIVYVDSDLGIVQFQGKLGESTKLSKDLLETDESIYVANSYSLPSRGYIEINDGTNSEVIEYGFIERNQLRQLTRTNPLSFSINDDTLVTPVSRGVKPDIGDTVVALYEAIPRIEYETRYKKPFAKRFLNNFNAYFSEENNSIVCIDRKNKKIKNHSIEGINTGRLFINGKTFYGPITRNEDSATVFGQVRDRNGNPIINSKVIIKTSRNGRVNNLPEAIVYTNSEGNYWFEYRPDKSEILNPILNILAGVNSTEHITENGEDFTIIEFDEPQDGSIIINDLNTISLYAITKDSAPHGTVGNKFTFANNSFKKPIKWLPNIELISQVPFTDKGIILQTFSQINDPFKYIEGKIRIIYDDNSSETSTIHNFFKATLVRESYYQDFNTWIIETENELTNKEIKHIFLIGKHDVEWDQVERKGRYSVLYKADSSGQWLHPAKENQSPVYRPVSPIEYLGNGKFKFKEHLPIPNELNNDENLGGYAMYVPQMEQLIAYAEETNCSDARILSNKINFIIELGEVDNGTVKIGENYVPYGFRIIDQHSEVSSTIDLATYLTINDLSSFNAEVPLISYVDNNTIIYKEESSYNPIPNSIGYKIVVK